MKKYLLICLIMLGCAARPTLEKAVYLGFNYSRGYKVAYYDPLDPLVPGFIVPFLPDGAEVGDTVLAPFYLRLTTLEMK